MNVAVGLITNQQYQVLITQRNGARTEGGLWEFPGGKLEPDETAPAALIREIKEEVGLDIVKFELIGEVDASNAHQSLRLFVFHISDFVGTAVICEDQMSLRWVSIDELRHFAFPAANQQIIEMLSGVY